MIFVFHSLYFLLRHLFKAYSSTKAIHKFHKNHFFQQSEVIISNPCHYDEENSLCFDPPVYRQRYVAVQQVLLHDKWRSKVKKVVDFGCSEMKFFTFLKHLMGLDEILFVDIDEEILKENVFRTRPLTTDYLKRRSAPLKIQILCGSISDPDIRLKGIDAVIAIEIIEHLYPDTLEAMPYNIFHHIQPLIAIFTTPNADFNLLLPDPKKFRHFDHKFEWTREQFESWAHNVTVRFPKYRVLFEGIGNGPEEQKSLGCCSQMAIFIRKGERLSEVPRSCREISLKKDSQKLEVLKQSHGICTYYSYSKQVLSFEDNHLDNSIGNDYYKLIDAVEYPFEIDERSSEEKVLDEVMYKIYSSARYTSRFYNEENNRLELPLYELTSNEDGCFITVSEIRKLLLQKGTFAIEECVVFGNDKKVLCVVYDLNMDNRSSSPGSETNNDNEETNFKIPWQEETDWDAEYIEKDKTSNQTNKLGNNLQQSEELITYQYHSSLPNTSIEIKEDETLKQPKNKVSLPKVQSSCSGTSKHTPKKGTNIKNRDASHNMSQGSSKENEVSKRSVRKVPELTKETNLESDNKKVIKKNYDVKIIDSTHINDQGPSISKNSSKVTKSSLPIATKNKSKITTTSPRKSYTKVDHAIPSTSDFKKKKKSKKPEDENKEDIKTLTECIVYNSLNKILEDEEIKDEEEAEEQQEALVIEQPVVENGDLANNNRDLEGNNYPDDPPQNIEDNEINANENVVEDIRNQDFQNRNEDIVQEEERAEVVHEVPLGHELNHASREALFDPNSEVDMLEEFEIANAPDEENVIVAAHPHHNVLLIGLNINTNDEENVVLPENADPFPNWLLQLLGANVEEGESHDEPHFYCQGDGIGVHPSIVEVEIDEEESSSDSSSSNDEAVAEHTLSEPAVALPDDDDTGIELSQEEALDVIGRVILPEARPLPNAATPGSTSNAESADEFFDTLDESLLLNDSPNSNTHSVNNQE